MSQQSDPSNEPAEVRFYKENHARFRDSDVFLASVPRSGNTWMRLLLSDAILQHLNHETGTGGNIIPDVYKDKVSDWDHDPRLSELDFRIIKTHQPFDPVFGRVIYIFRHPADCFTSLYHYQFRYEGFRELNMSIESFFDKCVDTWLENMRSYIEAARQVPERLMFMSYESLHDDAAGQLGRSLHFLGLDVSDATCRRAVEQQSFKRLKLQAEQGDAEELGFKEDGGVKGFFRSGRVKSAKDEVHPEALEDLERKTRDVLAEAKALIGT